MLLFQQLRKAYSVLILFSEYAILIKIKQKNRKEQKMKELIIIGVSFLVAIGLLNYFKAVVRDGATQGKKRTFVYILMQILMTTLYLLPTGAVLAYGIIVYLTPLDFVGGNFFRNSLFVAFGVIALFLLLSIILLRKSRNFPYNRAREPFMYSMSHRSVLCFILSAFAITGLIFGISNQRIHSPRVITSYSDIGKYDEKKYLYLDLTGAPQDANYIISTGLKCETLIIKGGGKEIRNLAIKTYADTVIFDGVTITNDERDIIIADEATVELKGNASIKLGGGIVFKEASTLNLTKGTLDCNVIFEKSGSLDVMDISSIGGRVSFSSDAELNLYRTLTAPVYVGGNAVFRLYNDATVNSQLVIGADSSSLTFENMTALTGQPTLPSTDIYDKDLLGEAELYEEIFNTPLKVSFNFEDRNADFLINMRGASLIAEGGILFDFDNMLTLSFDGTSYLCSNADLVARAKAMTVLFGDKLEIKSNASGGNAISAETVRFVGNGELVVEGADGTNSGESGGYAIMAEELILDGAISATLRGGNGATGAQGSQGDTGTPGAKGNNESQGSDKEFGYNGRPGEKGGTGKKGGTGGNGGDALIIGRLSILSEEATLSLIGGDAGDGGKGGKGGTGGRGGNGGDDDRWSPIWIGDMSGGEGGEGGEGGDGGEGGAPGTAGSGIFFSGDELELSDAVSIENGEAGSKGDKGDKGDKGGSGSHGDGGVGG